MVTIGKGIAPLDPFSALVAVLAGAFTIHVFTQVGVPVSSSQASSVQWSASASPAMSKP